MKILLLSLLIVYASAEMSGNHTSKVTLANLVRSADSGAWSHQIGGALIGAHYYFVVKEKKSWDLARKSCKEKGGDLAVLATYEAIDSIKPFIVDTGIYWVGAAKNPSKAKNAWFWLSGEPIPQSFGRWRKDEPQGLAVCLAYHKVDTIGNEGLCDDGCDNNEAVGYICQLH